jgi:hypothetical protein
MTVTIAPPTPECWPDLTAGFTEIDRRGTRPVYRLTFDG